MNTITKSLLYFGSTILLGNILLIGSEYLQSPENSIVSMIPSIKSFFGFIMLSGAFCLPLFIPTLLFFALMKTYKPYFPVNIGFAAVFGLVTSVAWVFVLNLMADWLQLYYFWLPFVVAATLSGVLVELVFSTSQKPVSPAHYKSRAPTLSSQNV